MFMKKYPLLLFVLSLVLCLVSCGKDKELILRVDSLSKTIEELSNENKDLQASIKSIEEKLEFNAPEYPIIYSLTEKSYEEFKIAMIEAARVYANATGISEDELNETLAMLEVMDINQLVKEIGGDLINIVFLNEREVNSDGYISDYYIKDGNLYVDGYKAGLIDEDILTLLIEEDGINVALNFYRVSPKGNEKLTLAERLDAMEVKINEIYSL